MQNTASLLLLYVLVRRVVLPRAGSVIEERRNRIKGNIALAEEIRSDTQVALARYTQAVADARFHASEVVNDVRQKVKLEVTRSGRRSKRRSRSEFPKRRSG